MSAEHTHAAQSDAQAPLATAERMAEARREAFRGNDDVATRAQLIGALAALAGQQHAAGNDAASAEALAEADALVLSPSPSDEPWQARMMMLCLVKAGIAQSKGSHAEAVDLFEQALGHIPYAPGEGGRDVNAARLQLLVRMAHSRLALAQAAETVAEAEQCDTVMTALAGQIPDRALDTIRAAVLANHGEALTLLGEADPAEEKFTACLNLIERIGGENLEPLRQRVVQARARAGA
jgi:tetratricopeptide (TPR) repeat protein